MKATQYLIAGLIMLMMVGCQQNTQPTVETPNYDPNKTAEINVKLGIGHMREGNYETALKKLKRAIQQDPSYPDAHSVLGLLYQKLGEKQLAEQHLKKAIELRPDHAGALNNYGQFLCAQGRADEGAAMFLRAVENPLNPSPEVAYTNAGLCAYNNGDRDSAESDFRNALQRNPRVAPALLHMSRISYEQGNYLSARGYLQRYLELTRHSAQSLWLGIRIERELGDKDTQSSYELLLRNNFPDSDEVRLLNE